MLLYTGRGRGSELADAHLVPKWITRVKLGETSMRAIQVIALPPLQVMWRHRWLAVAVAWLVCIGGWISVGFLPTRYESGARVYVNADPVLTPLLKGLAAETDPTRQVDFMRRTLLSRPNLEEVARLSDLTLGNTQQRQALLAHLATNIRIDAITSNLLSISYRDSNPVLAKNIVQSLITIFAEKTTGSSRKDMDAAQQFLDSEIESYRKQLHAAELRRADLNRRYPELFPIDNANGSRLDQARATLTQLLLQLSDATANRDSLRKQLESVPPLLRVDRGLSDNLSISARLDAVRKRLDTLRLEYTEAYPDVITARRELARLEAEARNQPAVRAPGEGKAQIANAVYDQLTVKLAESEASVAGIERRLTQARRDVAGVQAALNAAPEIVAQAQDLDRDYGVLKADYESLVQRREAASIADAAHTKTDQIQFRLVDPPEVPVLPVEPKRVLFDALVLLLGIGAGVAAPLAFWQIDRSVETIGQLRSFGLPIIGSVSRLVTDAARRHVVGQVAVVCASIIVLLIAFGTLLARDSGFI